MTAPADLTPLLAERQKFKAFLISRLGSEADADDLLQNSLTKALQRADELRDDTKLVPWFYQLLRHAIVDHVRSRHAARQRDDTWAQENSNNDDETRRHVCRCFEALLPSLKSAQAELLRRVELDAEPVAHVAAALGLTPNNASVTLHRARRELRAKLETFCGECADTACLDCDCSNRHNAV